MASGFTASSGLGRVTLLSGRDLSARETMERDRSVSLFDASDVPAEYLHMSRENSVESDLDSMLSRSVPNEVFPFKQSPPSRRAGSPAESGLSRYEQDFEEEGYVGKGGFGAVVRVRNRLDGRQYAIKKVKLSTEGPQMTRVLREVKTMARLSHHQNVVRYYHSWVEKVTPSDDPDGDDPDASLDNILDMTEGVSLDPSEPCNVLFIQMQLCTQTLRELLQVPNRKVDIDQVRNVVRQVARGLDHIHQQGFIHRDIKPDNIFVEAGVMKIGDFGLTTKCRQGQQARVDPDDAESRRTSYTEVSLDSESGEVGTMTYASPELAAGGEYDSKVDLFSLGVVLYEMLHPFNTGMERAIKLYQLRSGIVSDDVAKAYPALVEVAKRLTSSDPKSRPSAFELLNHEFFRMDEKGLGELEAELESKTNLLEQRNAKIEEMARQQAVLQERISQLSNDPLALSPPASQVSQPVVRTLSGSSMHVKMHGTTEDALSDDGVVEHRAPAKASPGRLHKSSPKFKPIGLQ